MPPLRTRVPKHESVGRWSRIDVWIANRIPLSVWAAVIDGMKTDCSPFLEQVLHSRRADYGK